MLQHFQYKTLKNNWISKQWKISFLHMGKLCEGIYAQDGKITWLEKPDDNNLPKIESQIHDLMLYHVYEDHHPDDA